MDIRAINDHFGHMDLWLLDFILKGEFPEKCSVLDVGAGGGRNILYFLQQGYDVTAIDLKESEVQAINWMSKSFQNKSVARTGDVNDLSGEDRPFDLVICSRLLHFATNQETFVHQWTELGRVLAPGGQLYVTFNSNFYLDNTNPHVAAIGNKVWMTLLKKFDVKYHHQHIMAGENEETVVLLKRMSL